MADTIHLRAHAPVAERVLLPGDPGRALRLAQALTREPRMLNHNRGLWGYTGMAADGEPLTVQSTGMGGPSAAIVVEELVALGARRLVRVGTCGALVDGLALGELVAAERVLVADGTSRALGADGSVAPDPELLAGLRARARALTAVTTDLFYDEDVLRWADAGADVVEMESAAVLAVAARHGAAAGVLLAVSDLLCGGRRERIALDDLHAAELRLGEAALAALAPV
jgi:uridine phosphorylase